jgi:hypothetical protein
MLESWIHMYNIVLILCHVLNNVNVTVALLQVIFSFNTYGA